MDDMGKVVKAIKFAKKIPPWLWPIIGKVVLILSFILLITAIIAPIANILGVNHALGAEGYIVGLDYDVDPNSDEGKFYQRVLAARNKIHEEKDVTIPAQLIGATYTITNKYNRNFTYNDMDTNLIETLANWMVIEGAKIICTKYGEETEEEEEYMPSPPSVDPGHKRTSFDIFNNDKALRRLNSSKAVVDTKSFSSFEPNEILTCPVGYEETERYTIYDVSRDNYFEKIKTEYISMVLPNKADVISGDEFVEEIEWIENQFCYIFDCNNEFEYSLGEMPPEIMGIWQLPVLSCRVSSDCGIRRDPQSWEWKMHHGLDIVPPADKDPTIHAVADGTVVKVVAKYPNFRVDAYGYGNHITIRHDIEGKTYYSLYAHLKSVNPTIKIGEFVSAFAPIGIMGTSGYSTGVHLHLEIREGKNLYEAAMCLNDIYQPHCSGSIRSCSEVIK